MLHTSHLLAPPTPPPLTLSMLPPPLTLPMLPLSLTLPMLPPSTAHTQQTEETHPINFKPEILKRKRY